ncbi:hypothetical protein [Aeromonas veronii]|uniref:hypothetical protein n=1 Tax=Aeromonas veronii TaxID=654 RepID=UPI003BA37C8A
MLILSINSDYTKAEERELLIARTTPVTELAANDHTQMARHDILSSNYAAAHFSNGLAFSKTDYARQLVPELEKVTVEIPTVAAGEFNGEFSRSTFTLLHPEDFLHFLEINGIAQAQRITDAFMNGVQSDPSCHGLRSECVILTDEFAVVIDYYQKKVRLFVTPDWIGQGTTVQEYLNVSGDNIIKNRLSAFFNKNDYGNNLMISNQGYAGFMDGFFYHNVDVNDEGSILNDFNYTWLAKNKKSQVGRSSRGQYFNYAYSKSYLANTLFQGIVVGTSEELNLKKSDNSVTFFSPIPAVLTIAKGKETIYKRYINAGMGSVSYEELPRGLYQAELLITTEDGALIHSTPTFIVNDGSNFASAFELFAQYGSGTDQLLPVYGVGASLPIVDHVVLYSALQSVDENPHISVGIEYRNDQFSVAATASKDDHSKGYDITLLWQGLSVSYASTDDNGVTDNREDASRVSTQDQRQRALRVNYSHSIGENTTVSYSYTNNDSNFDQSASYGASVAMPIWKGIFMSLGYDRRVNEDSANISLSIPLGLHLTTSVLSAYDGSQWRTRATAQYMNHYDDVLSYNLGVTAGREHERNLSSGVNYNGAHANISSRLSLSEQQGNAYGMQLDSLQLLSKEGLDILNPYKMGDHDSYILLPHEMKEHIDVSYSRAGESSHAFASEDHRAVGVTSYERYQVSAKIKSGEYVFENLSDRMKEHVDLIPGKAMSVQRSPNKVLDNIIKLESPVTAIRCHGKGCVSVENIQDDLYRVRMFTGGEVSLSSDRGYCHAITEQEREANRGQLTRLSCENT